MVKRIKASSPDLERLLARGAPEALASLGRLVPDEEARVGLLLDLVEGPWRDVLTPTRAAGQLLMMGRSDALLDLCLEVGDDWVLQDDERQTFGHGGVFQLLGQTLDEALWRRLLDALGDATAVDSEARPSWPRWVSVLADCGERGLRDERAWAWLQRVLDDTPPLWCIYAGAYGDARAVPVLQALLRGHADLALAATGPRGDDDDVVIEAASALERLGALDDELQALCARHAEALQTRDGARP